jgi:tetratricopeptide (TPR) repeat protein
MLKKIGILAMALGLASSAVWAATPLETGVLALQHEWEAIRYQSTASEKLGRWERLAAQSQQLVAQYPQQAEPLIWQGIVLSSWAGDKGGLGALSMVKEAKVMYEKALAINPQAMEGSAYNSLGVLYYKVPGWPIGFGDKEQAKALLEKALQINPKGIDPNFFYGEYWAEVGRPDQARVYLERALAAPPRPSRHIADTGRKEEIRALINTLKPSSAAR